ncbi:MAG: hypothetical protein H6566_24665 [Lewinellaceae bacterium]|nr:hypothetical protein [Lewinellaceae bacterium]
MQGARAFTINRLLFLGMVIIQLACNRQAAPDDKPQFPVQPADSLSNTSSDSLLPATEPHLMASLKRTPCYGRCPVYEVQFFSNGEVVFKGERNIKRLGIFLAQAPDSTLQRLREEARLANFFALSDVYPENGDIIEDLPETITFFADGKRQKTITNYYNAPLALLRFEQFLDNVASGLNWQPKVE